MRAVVEKTFRDKVTRKVYRAGQEIEISQERLEEINSTALGIFVEKKQKPKKEGV